MPAKVRKPKSLPAKSAKRAKLGKLAERDSQDKAHAVGLVTRLMAIRGKSGEETGVADFIRSQIRKAGAPDKWFTSDTAHRNTPIVGAIGNLCLKIPGTTRGPRRLLMAHMDTVPICQGSQPRRQGDTIMSSDPATGLGADDRAGVAVVLKTALDVLKNDLPHPPLTFLWTVQEEVGLHGARNLRVGMLGKPRLAFNWDGGGPAKMTVGATGGYRLLIEITGHASHAGNSPEEGVSAIAIASIAIAELQRGGWHGNVIKGNHHGTSNVGYIQGGEATNVVTDRVVVKAEARSHDPGFRKRLVQEIENAFHQAAREVKSSDDKTGKVHITERLDYESFRLDQNDPSQAAAFRAIEQIGLQPLPAVTNGGLDANWMFKHGLPTVTMGCGQRNPHMVSEALDITDFWNACRIARLLATATESSTTSIGPTDG